MAIDYVAYSGKSNVGTKMKTNEDYILFNDHDFGDNLYVSIADGAGSKESMFRPASIASHQVEKMLARLYKKNKNMFMDNIRIFMEEAFFCANDVLISFKLGDEEERMNFATTLTCALIEPDGKLTFAHAGNTRLYIIRDGTPLQLTKDHTEGQKLVDAKAITEDDYYTAIERLRLFNGVGVSPQPFVQTSSVKLKKNDVVVMTTDGIHYAYRPEAFFDILLRTQTMDEAAEEMIKTALDLKVYPDNISVNIIWYLGTD